MIEIDAGSPVPIYDQIKAALRGQVARGMLRPGDPAPSVRGLAAHLRVNPNTVARAFRELGQEGFFESRRGEGNRIASSARERAKDGLGEARSAFAESVRQARRGGLPWSAILELIRGARGEEK